MTEGVDESASQIGADPEASEQLGATYWSHHLADNDHLYDHLYACFCGSSHHYDLLHHHLYDSLALAHTTTTTTTTTTDQTSPP